MFRQMYLTIAKGNTMKLKKLAAMLLGFSLVFWLTCTSMAADNNKVYSAEEIIQGTVTVQSVDVPNRLVTVKDSTGAMQTMDVPASVKNLPQLKAGDRITIHYKVGLAAGIKKPGEASKSTEARESAASAPPGAKPGGMAQRMVRTLITVKAVDPVKNMLTFEGPKERTRTIAVKDPEMQDLLKQLKPGDQVEVAYTEALMIDVQAAKQ
jgi:Cu/Ag efflux protein CusF